MIGTIILSLGYVLIWYILQIIARLMQKYGFGCLLSETFGSWIIYVGYAFVFALTLLPLVLFAYNKIRKKHINYFKVSYLSTGIFCTVVVIMCMVLSMYYSDFTPPKWESHPCLRTFMVSDLEENNKLIGKNEAEVTMLLGAPDAIQHESNRKYYNYLCGDYGRFLVCFIDDTVQSVIMYAN